MKDKLHRRLECQDKRNMWINTLKLVYSRITRDPFDTGTYFEMKKRIYEKNLWSVLSLKCFILHDETCKDYLLITNRTPYFLYQCHNMRYLNRWGRDNIHVLLWRLIQVRSPQIHVWFLYKNARQFNNYHTIGVCCMVQCE